ncbi:hypothetical protein C1H46_012416 [Malus baccata]|uniref:non-specific serine/threonine protein kinase n=1 Tax=Malus baccata TaxID=106549 RepID=A0A540MT79_MALBA|nr:hypothetical protein C1H46_012416 [Malus baccata]
MDRQAMTVGPALDMPIMHDSDRYDFVRDIGSGNFGVARLMTDRQTRELVAVKYIERGNKIDENVRREIINHRSLRHPNIIRFKEARFFFQQLISGVSYCHAMQVCHRDLKLENTLLDGSQAPRLKICDFGYSKIADVWSCGVTLYVMLVGAYPFEDPDEPKDFRRTIQRILSVQYSIPDTVQISHECLELISRIFVPDPAARISIPEIKNHSWFLKNLPADLMDESNQFEEPDQPMQSLDAIMHIIEEATIPAAGTLGLGSYMMDNLDMDDDMDDLDSESELDVDSSGEIVYAI